MTLASRSLQENWKDEFSDSVKLTEFDPNPADWGHQITNKPQKALDLQSSVCKSQTKEVSNEKEVFCLTHVLKFVFVKALIHKIVHTCDFNGLLASL